MTAGPAGEHGDHGTAADKKVRSPETSSFAGFKAVNIAEMRAFKIVRDWRRGPRASTTTTAPPPTKRHTLLSAILLWRDANQCAVPPSRPAKMRTPDGCLQAKAKAKDGDAAVEAAGHEVIDLDAHETAAVAAAAPAAAAGRGAAGKRAAAGGKPGGKPRAPKRKPGRANGAADEYAAGGGSAMPVDVLGDGADGGEAAVAAAAADSITSANAYLLVYRRRTGGPAQPPPHLPAR